jgi:Putative Ig domain
MSHRFVFFSGTGQRATLIASTLALLFGASCTGGSSPSAPGNSPAIPGNHPPVITSATLLNDPISLSGPVGVQVYADDPEREAVAFQYQWYVDNAALPKQTEATLPAEVLRRGQTVMVEIIPMDGSQKGAAYRTKAVVVGNTAPKVMSVALMPQPVPSGGRIEAQVEVNDPDHDRIDLAYKWFSNDVLVKEGEEPFLDTTGLKSREKIQVEVMASDSAGSGSSLRSELLVLGNSAPKIVSNPPAPGASDQFEYSIRAVDSDGDSVTFRLETAPPGMIINGQSGQITWPIPSNQQGTFHVKVMAEDGQGGTAFQEFDLTVSAPNPVPAKPAEGA